MSLLSALLVILSVPWRVTTLSFKNPAILRLLVRTYFILCASGSLKSIPNSSTSSYCVPKRVFRIAVWTSVRVRVESSRRNRYSNSMGRVFPGPFIMVTTVFISPIRSAVGRLKKHKRLKVSVFTAGNRIDAAKLLRWIIWAAFRDGY